MNSSSISGISTIGASALILTMVITAGTALASDWSDVDVRGLKLNMSFDEASAKVNEQWSGVKVNTSKQAVAFADQRFEYWSQINLNVRGPTINERLLVRLNPPARIKDGPTASVVSQVSYTADIAKGGSAIKLADLTAKLSAKYGEATSMDRLNTAMWTYTKSGEGVTDEIIAKSRLSALAECEAIDQEIQAARRAKEKVDNTQYQKLAQCRSGAELIKSCRRGSNKFCPFNLAVKWRTLGGDKSLLRGYSMTLTEYGTGSTLNKRIMDLREELKPKVEQKSVPAADIKL